MMKKKLIIAVTIALAWTAAAQAQTTVKKIPIKGTAINGETMLKQ